MASTGKGSREKGATFERDIAKMLRAYKYDTNRGDCGRHQADVIGLPGIHIECKKVEGMKVCSQLLTNALEQSEREAKVKDGGLPIVIHRENRAAKIPEKTQVTTRLWVLDELRGHPAIDLDNQQVTMSMADFMEVYKGWKA